MTAPMSLHLSYLRGLVDSALFSYWSFAIAVRTRLSLRPLQLSVAAARHQIFQCFVLCQKRGIKYVIPLRLKTRD